MNRRARDIRPGMQIRVVGGRRDGEVAEVQTAAKTGGTCYFLLRHGMFYTNLICDANQEVVCVRPEQRYPDRDEEDCD
jgi:hypothetical protein